MLPFRHTGLRVGATTTMKRVRHALGPVPSHVGNRRHVFLASLQGLGSHYVSRITFAIPIEDLHFSSIGS
ncbi:hypothetical protein D9M72_640100 [compost metagenome]